MPRTKTTHTQLPRTNARAFKKCACFARNARALCMLTSRPTNINFFSRKGYARRLGCQHTQLRRVACEATQGKTRQPKREQPRSEKKKAREVEGGGVVGAVFFHVFNFFPLNISYKTTFLLFCVFFTKLSVITNFVRTGAFSFLRAQTSLQFCILYNFKSFGT